MSRLFATLSNTTRHSHAAHGHNLNHLHGYKAPDKGLRYINRPIFRKGAPATFPGARQGKPMSIPTRHNRPRFIPISNIIYAGPSGARTISTSVKAPVHGMSSDGATKTANQMDNEGWVDPEEMPTLSAFARNATSEYDNEEMQSSPNTRRKNKAGTASAVPTDSEASLSADKQNLSTQELVRDSTNKVKKQRLAEIEDEEQPIHAADADLDIASHSTQGRINNSTASARTKRGQQEHHENPSKQSMMGKKDTLSGKSNEDVSHPAAYGSNPIDGNTKPKMKKRGGNDEWTA